MNVPSLSAVLAMSTRGKMELSVALNARLDTDVSGVSTSLWIFFLFCLVFVGEQVFWIVAGSPRVEGDEDEDDVDDIENEFNYAQGANKGRRQQRHGEEFSSSSRHESQPIPLLTHGHTVMIYI